MNFVQLYINDKKSNQSTIFPIDLSSLDFVVNRLFTKLFRTSSIDVVKRCQYHVDFSLPSVLWAKRVQKFEAKFYASNNLLCEINVW